MLQYYYFLSLISLLLTPTSSFNANTPAGRQLLSRFLENDNNNYDFLTGYSIKFQGCHHVQQWNDNADDENDVRIMTKRLVRFRLCETCDHEKGCNSKYGDYVVDMDTFVEAYLQGMEADKDNICAEAYADCQEECSDDDCMNTCYDNMNLSICYQDENQEFDAKDYAACQEFNFGRRQLEDGANNNNNNQYYIGAFCADQGGEIHLGMFTDDTCTTFASSGYTTFYNAMGYSMPYSESSLVTTRCLACGAANENGGYDSTEICENPYQLAGKCETRMSIDYPNESSCNYIEGIKIIREDGVIRTSNTKKSKAAAVGIGFFCTLAVILGAYVYYLRTKLARAQINLAASAQASLT